MKKKYLQIIFACIMWAIWSIAALMWMCYKWKSGLQCLWVLGILIISLRAICLITPSEIPHFLDKITKEEEKQ